MGLLADWLCLGALGVKLPWHLSEDSRGRQPWSGTHGQSGKRHPECNKLNNSGPSPMTRGQIQPEVQWI